MSANIRWLFITLAALAIIAGQPSSRVRAASYTGTPYMGSPVSLPGTVQAENFDNGGEGVAYHDTTPGNSGGAYRSTSVDIENSSDGNYDVGWTDTGEWLNYTVNVAATDTYTVALRVASPSGGGIVHVGFNGATNVWMPVSIPATGGWQTWTTVSFRTQISAGTQQLTLLFDTPGLNVASVDVASTSSGGSSSAYSGAPVSLPGTIQAANFDNGGEGAAYHDTTPGNSGGAYRATDVDVEPNSEGGFDVGWIAPGEWLNYSVSVGAAGSYQVQMRVAALAGGTLHASFDGGTGTAVVLPATGGWQNWTNVSFTTSLGAGAQTMTLYFDTAGFNVSTITVSSATGGSGGGTGGGGTGGGGTTGSAPTVSLTAPTNGGSFSAPATITVSANTSTASGSITKVDFYAGSTLIGTDSTSPYSISWNSVAAGTYAVTAKATNSSGLSSTSGVASITVNGSTSSPPPPSGSIILDDFSGPRANPGNPGQNIIQLYTGEDSGQSLSIGGGQLSVTGGSPGIYWQFLPYPYVPPMGWVKDWIESGTWPGTSTDRMRFAFKCSASVAMTSTGYGNIQVGTYTKAPDGQPANQGAHWYHMIDAPVTANRWVYMTFTRFVQHQVGQSPSTNWPENTSYYDQMTRFYFDTQDGNWGGNTCVFQPIAFAAVTGEPDQYVQSTAVAYDGSKYELDITTPKNSSTSYTIHYSTASMKTNGFASGTNGGSITASGNTYANVHWSSPAMAQPSGGMYIAIQPSGQSTFTEVFVPAN